jgi:hypothetical protein
MAFVLAGCSNAQEVGDRLAQELPQAYPGQIRAIAFENNPPIDPPTLFIDLAPSMDPDQQLRFLCDEVVPRVRATNTAIAVTVSYGWYDDDC